MALHGCHTARIRILSITDPTSKLHQAVSVYRETHKRRVFCDSIQLTTVPLSGFKFDPRKRKGEGSRRIKERTWLKDIGTPGGGCEDEERGPEKQQVTNKKEN